MDNSPAPPPSWRALTVYHQNPRSEGPVPVNMDTADIRGMLTFLLSSVAAPFACLHRDESGF